ncbi:MAG: ECF-type sigma factor [Bacteroidota bacterium]
MESEESNRDKITPSDRPFHIVYDELVVIAQKQLRRYRTGQTIDTVALVHEAYIKLNKHDPDRWNDDAHFFATAARAMRQILVDYARRQYAERRGGHSKPTSLSQAERATIMVDTEIVEILDLDKALTQLSALNERLGKVVELRFFSGLSIEETARVLQVTKRTIDRDWFKAKAFLFRAIQGYKEEGGAE